MYDFVHWFTISPAVFIYLGTQRWATSSEVAHWRPFGANLKSLRNTNTQTWNSHEGFWLTLGIWVMLLLRTRSETSDCPTWWVLGRLSCQIGLVEKSPSIRNAQGLHGKGSLSERKQGKVFEYYLRISFYFALFLLDGLGMRRVPGLPSRHSGLAKGFSLKTNPVIFLPSCLTTLIWISKSIVFQFHCQDRVTKRLYIVPEDKEMRLWNRISSQQIY